MANYISAPAKVTECYECGNVELCEVLIADSPEVETGYVDEYAVCEACKSGVQRLGVPDIFGNDWHG